MLDKPKPKKCIFGFFKCIKYIKRMTKKDRFKFGDKYKCDRHNIVLAP